MKTDYDTSWATLLDDIYVQHRKFYYEDDERAAALKALSDLNDLIGGYFELKGDFQTLVQRKSLPWESIFEILSATQRCSIVLLDMTIPKGFSVEKGKTPKAYASYMPEKNAVNVEIYTGRSREDLSGYDGYGREPDELEVIRCLRDRDGNIIEDWHSEWI
ncbi:MAG: hypothetical protein LIO91_08800 [Bacteroidales bacterium]|nr:hypothetical protein [Bacteroidales bacterium]